MGPRHPVRPERTLQPAHPPLARSCLHTLRRPAPGGALPLAGRLSETRVVQQRHPPPLRGRKARAGLRRRLSAQPDGTPAARGPAPGAGRDGRRLLPRGVPRHLRPRRDAHARQPQRRRRPAAHLCLQLLRPRRDAGRGRGFLRRAQGPRRPAPRHDGPQQPPRQGGRRAARTHVARGRPLRRGHRKNCGKPARGTTLCRQRRATGRHRHARRLLPHGRPAHVRPLHHPMARRDGRTRRLCQRIYRNLRRPARAEGQLGGIRQLYRHGSHAPHRGAEQPRPMVRGPLARRPALQEDRLPRHFGPRRHGGHAGRRPLSVDCHRYQPAQLRLGAPRARLEERDHR